MLDPDLPPPRSAASQESRPLSLLREPSRQPSLRDERLFSLAMLGDFGRFDFDAHNDDVIDSIMELRWRSKMLLDSLSGIAHTSVKRSVFDVNASPQADGCSLIVDQIGVMSISIGLIARTYRSAYALMTLPEVFADVGPCENGNATSRDLFDAIFDGSGECLDLDTPNKGTPSRTVFATLMPASQDRCWIAHGIAGLLLQWVLYHEWFHQTAGHLMFARLQTKNPLLKLHEQGEELEGNTLAPELAQLVEADADRRASWRLGNEIVQGGLMLTALKEDQWDIPQKLEGWALMQTFFFWWLSFEGRGIDYPVRNRPTQHPHPAVRFWTVVQRVQGELEAMGCQAYLEDYFRGVKTSVRVFRRLHVDVGLPAPECFSPDSELIHEILDEVNSYNDRFEQDLFPRIAEWDFSQRAKSDDRQRERHS